MEKAELVDKRVFERISVKIPLRYLDLRFNKEGEVETRDICAKGIGLVTQEELLPDTDLEMWLEVPDNGEPLYTRGRVVWSRQIESNKYWAGVNLEKADFMGLSRILRVSK